MINSIIDAIPACMALIFVTTLYLALKDWLKYGKIDKLNKIFYEDKD